jgi:hypothetical protein
LPKDIFQEQIDHLAAWEALAIDLYPRHRRASIAIPMHISFDRTERLL